MREVGNVGEHRGRDVQEEDVHNNHALDEAQDAGVLEHQVQTRVEDERLAGDHRPPADGEEGDGEPGGGGQAEEFDQVSDGVRNNADTGDEHAPEIRATVTFEGEEDEDDQFEHIVPSDTDESRDGDAYTETVPSVATRDPVAWTCLAGRHDMGKELDLRWESREEENPYGPRGGFSDCGSRGLLGIGGGLG